MLSPSLQDYLEEVYRLWVTTHEIRVSEIANILNVSLPSVVKALHKLDDNGYICYKPYCSIILTEKGIKEGVFLVQRNQILKDFLSVLEVGCDVDKEAEAMEHYLSFSTIQSIEKFVCFMSNHPKIKDDFHKHCNTENNHYKFT